MLHYSEECFLRYSINLGAHALRKMIISFHLKDCLSTIRCNIHQNDFHKKNMVYDQITYILFIYFSLFVCIYDVCVCESSGTCVPLSTCGDERTALGVNPLFLPLCLVFDKSLCCSLLCKRG